MYEVSLTWNLYLVQQSLLTIICYEIFQVGGLFRKFIIPRETIIIPRETINGFPRDNEFSDERPILTVKLVPVGPVLGGPI